MKFNTCLVLGTTRTLAAALTVAALCSLASAENLILDGSSFEVGHDGFSSLLAYSWTKHGLAASNPRRGVIDSSTSAHGRCSLKMSFKPPYGRQGFSPWCAFRWIKIKEGQRHPKGILVL